MTDTEIVRPTADIIRRLRAGETLTTKQVAEDYGSSTALLHATLAAMRKGGCTFTIANGDDVTTPNAYTIESPKPPRGARSTWGKGENVVISNTGKRSKEYAAKPKVAKAQKAKKVNGTKSRELVQVSALETTTKAVARLKHSKNGALAHPVPNLGDNVQVYLLMLDDNGNVNVGLRSDSAAWLVGIDGFAARDREPQASGG